MDDDERQARDCPKQQTALPVYWRHFVAARSTTGSRDHSISARTPMKHFIAYVLSRHFQHAIVSLAVRSPSIKRQQAD